jgi:regulator of RNase E activity RraA
MAQSPIMESLFQAFFNVILIKIMNLVNFSTGDIADALLQLGFPSCFLPDLVGHTVTQRIAGPVYNIQYDTFDKTGISYPLDDCPSQSIVLIHTPEHLPNAVWGGLMGTRAKMLNVAGVVTNGRFRDVEDLERLQFPVYAKGKSCLGAKPFVKPVAVNVPLTFQHSEHYSVTVNPGDWIVADRDGVVIVPATLITKVIEKCSVLANLDVQCAQYLMEGHSLKDTFAKYR